MRHLVDAINTYGIFKHLSIIKCVFSHYGDRMSLEERLKSARKSAGLTQPDLCNALGISKRALVSYEKDASKIQIGLLYKIANICHVDDVWLLTGKGEMFLTENNIDPIPKPQNNDIVSYQDVVEAEHAKLIRGFKNKERAKRLNEKLIKLEDLSEVQLDKLEQDIDKRIEVAEDVLNEREKKENGEMSWKGTDRRRNQAS